MPFYDDKAATINALIEAVEAIETELGLLPAGAYASVRTRLDILEARINNPFAPAPNALNPFYIGNTGVSIQTSYGDPNTLNVLAIPGSLYLREDGYNDQGLYAFRPDGYWHQIDTDPWTACGDLAGTIYCQTVIGIQGRAINPAAPQTDSEGDGYVLTWNQNLNWWEPQIGFFAAGDLAGNKISQTVVNLQGNKLSVNSPQDGYVITWNNTLSQWEGQTPAVIWDPKDNPFDQTNIRTNRPGTQSTIDNTQTGIVNLGSDTSQLTLGVTASYSSILGGDQNEVGGTYSTIVGGLLNVVNGTQAFIGSGNSNIAGASSAILTGTGNFASGTQFSFVGTGNVNLITAGIFNTIENGQMNSITASFSTILNGTSNAVMGSGQYATILGGNTNIIATGPLANQYSLIGQGVDGYISDQALFSVIINGNANKIWSGNGAVVSGSFNQSYSAYVTIQGDTNIVGQNSNANYSTVWGSANIVNDGYVCLYGYKDTLNAGSIFADIHGDNNTVSSSYTSIWGSRNVIGTGDGYDAIFGYNNTIGSNSNYTYIWGASNNVGNSVVNSGIWGPDNTINNNVTFAWMYGNINTVNSNSNWVNLWGTNNQVTGNYQSAWGNSNTVTALSSGYSSAWGSYNTVIGDWSNAWGFYNQVNSVSYANVFGYWGSARMQGQFVHSSGTASGGTVAAGSEQYSRVILDGNALSGGTFNLNIAGTSNPVTFEDGKVYDITIRILMTQSSGATGVAASFVFDVLAHQESGTAILDSVNSTLSDPNGTGWSVNVTASGNQLLVTVPAFGSTNRRAVATVEWRELSRN